MPRLKSVNSLAAGLIILIPLATRDARAADNEFLMPAPAGSTSAPDGSTGFAPSTSTLSKQAAYRTRQRWAERSQILRASAEQSSDVISAGGALPPQSGAPSAGAQSGGAQSPAMGQPAGPGMSPGTAPRAISPSAPGGMQPTPGSVPPFPETASQAPPDVLRRPSQLPKVTSILPFADYEPDPIIARDDPCQNLCPRPDGAPCKPNANGRPPECPKEVQLGEAQYVQRSYSPALYTWEASNICYNPLYFQDPALERYGHTYPFFLQPVASIGRFAVQFVGLPYQMTIDQPRSAVFPLGYYRPGECAPKLCYQIPWNTHAAAVEAATVTGVWALFAPKAF